MPNIVEIVIRGTNELGDAFAQAQAMAAEFGGVEVPIYGHNMIASALEEAQGMAAEAAPVQLGVEGAGDIAAALEQAHGQGAESGPIVLPIEGRDDVAPAIEQAHLQGDESGPIVLPITARDDTAGALEQVREEAEHVTIDLPVTATSSIGRALEEAAQAATETAPIVLPITGISHIGAAIEQAHAQGAESGPIVLPIKGSNEVAAAIEEAHTMADESGPITLPIKGSVQLEEALAEAQAQADQGAAEIGAAFAADLGSTVAAELPPKMGAAATEAAAEFDAAWARSLSEEDIAALPEAQFEHMIAVLQAEAATGGAEIGSTLARSISLDMLTGLNQDFDNFTSGLTRKMHPRITDFMPPPEEAAVAGEEAAAAFTRGWASGLSEEQIAALPEAQFTAMTDALQAEAAAGGGRVGTQYARALAASLSEGDIAALPEAQFTAMIAALEADAAAGGEAVGATLTKSMNINSLMAARSDFIGFTSSLEEADNAAQATAGGLQKAGASAAGAGAGMAGLGGALGGIGMAGMMLVTALPPLISYMETLSGVGDHTGQSVSLLASQLETASQSSDGMSSSLENNIHYLGLFANSKDNLQGIKDLDTALTQLYQVNPGDAEKEYQKIASMWESEGKSAQTVAAALPNYTAAVKNAATAQEAAALSGQHFDQQMRAAATSAQQAAQQQAITSVSALNLGTGLDGVNSRLIGSLTAYSQASGAASAYNSVLTAMNGTVQTLIGAQDKFDITLGQLTASVKANGTELQGDTVKAAQNRDAFIAAAQAAQGHAVALYQSEIGTKGATGAFNDATADLGRQKQAFIEAADKAGYNKQQVQALADQLFKLPSNITVTTHVDTTQAVAAVGRLIGLLGIAQAAGSIATAAIGSHVSGGPIGAASGGGRGGLTWVGEEGPELLDLPYGSMVHSAPDSAAMAAAGGGGGEVRVMLDWAPGAGGGDELLTWLRRSIRARAGTGPESVQMALGQ